jgi:hypothetical protein
MCLNALSRFLLRKLSQPKALLASVLLKVMSGGRNSIDLSLINIRRVRRWSEAVISAACLNLPRAAAEIYELRNQSITVTTMTETAA